MTHWGFQLSLFGPGPSSFTLTDGNEITSGCNSTQLFQKVDLLRPCSWETGHVQRELQPLWINVVTLISTFDILIGGVRITSKMGTCENDKVGRARSYFVPESEALLIWTVAFRGCWCSLQKCGCFTCFWRHSWASLFQHKIEKLPLFFTTGL